VAAISLLLLLAGCSGVDENGLSPQFKAAGRDAYEILHSTAKGSSTTTRDVDLAIAHSRAATQNAADRQAQQTLETFDVLLQTTGCAGLVPSENCIGSERAAFDACHRLSANYFDPQDEQTIVPPRTSVSARHGADSCAVAMDAMVEQEQKERTETKVPDPVKCKGWSKGLLPQFKNEPCPYLIPRSRAIANEKSNAPPR
jgi:hypothetical protein